MSGGKSPSNRPPSPTNVSPLRVVLATLNTVLTSQTAFLLQATQARILIVVVFAVLQAASVSGELGKLWAQLESDGDYRKIQSWIESSTPAANCCLGLCNS